MQHQILIIMTASMLTAAEIDTHGNAEQISIDGNIVINYQCVDDLKHFNACIKDYYNIEQYSELDVSVMLLKCGVAAEYAVALLQLFFEATSYELIDALRILPLAVRALGYIKRPEAGYRCSGLFSLLDSRYVVSANDDYQVKCQLLDYTAEPSIALHPKDFGFLFLFDAKKFAADDTRLQAVQAELAAAQQESARRIAGLEERLRRLDAQKEEWEKKEAAYRQRITGLENKQKNAQRYLVRAVLQKKPLRSSASTMYPYPFMDPARVTELRNTVLYHYEIVFRASLRDGDIVQKGQSLAVIESLNREGAKRDDYIPVDLRSPSDGRLFFLVKDHEAVKDGDMIAIIGAAADTREDALRWYRSLTDA